MRNISAIYLKDWWRMHWSRNVWQSRMVVLCCNRTTRDHMLLDTRRQFWPVWTGRCSCLLPILQILPPNDFRLFAPMKRPLRGVHFQSLEEVKQASTTSNILQKPSKKGLKKRILRWKKCIVFNGDHVEKCWINIDDFWVNKEVMRKFFKLIEHSRYGGNTEVL